MLLKTPESEVDILSVETDVVLHDQLRYPTLIIYGSVEPNEVDGLENELDYLELELDLVIESNCEY